MKPNPYISFFCILPSLFLLACFTLEKKQEQSSSTTKNINIYASAQKEWISGIGKEFTLQTDINVSFVRKPSNQVLAELSEKGHTNVDIWFGGPIDSHIQAAEKGLLQPYCSKNQMQLREGIRDPLGNCQVTGLYAGILGFAVNISMLQNAGKKIPTSWQDLIDKQYKGLIAMARPESSGTAFTALRTVLKMKGEPQAWDYLDKLHANLAHAPSSGSSSAELVANNKASIGIVFLHDAIALAQKGYSISPIAPTEGSGYEIGGISLLKNAAHKNSAKRFIDWALRKETQMLARTFSAYQLPSNKHVSLPEEMRTHRISFEDVKIIPSDPKWNAKNRTRILSTWKNKVVGN